MEELRCEGTPAQVARRVFAILAQDADLLWLTDAGRTSYSQAELDNLSFWGRRVPTIPDDQELIKIMVLRGTWPVIGYITAERLPDYVLVTAHNRSHSTTYDQAGAAIVRENAEDFSALAPVWQRVKAELERCGLVMAAEPAKKKVERGPTEKTRLRAEVFKKIKDARPGLGYDAVADEAMRLCPELGDGITAETVRHAYRSMGWTWERADRIR